MKAYIISDIHSEFCESKISKQNNIFKHIIIPDDIDLVIIAGDISNNIEDHKQLFKQIKQPIVFVAGNHEFYKREYYQQIQELESLNSDNVHFLNNSTFEMNGTTFVGGTLWTDMRLTNSQSLHLQLGKKYMNDFRIIRYAQGTLTPDDTLLLHNTTIDCIRQTLIKKDNVVIVTHHGMCPRSIDIDYKGDFSNDYYVSDYDSLIREYSPKAVIHGHVHTPFRYNIGYTELLCNPMGYYGERKDTTVVPMILDF